MTAILATIIATHFFALGAVLLMARHSVLLVDEHGRPLKRASWKEQIVPSSEVPTASPHR